MNQNAADLGIPRFKQNQKDSKREFLREKFNGHAVCMVPSLQLLIDTTIKLAMFSNRFLIKTMQMVGATRVFIARPFDLKAVVNGMISAGIAIVAIILLIFWAEQALPDLKALRDNLLLAILFGGILFLGVSITFISTHRAVVKYLKMKLDDLY